MRIHPAAAALLLLLPSVAPLAAQQTITKSEIRTAPPAETNRRLRDQVWNMFEVEDRRSARAPRQPLERLWLKTRPRGTEVPGLCQVDDAIVEFAPVARVSENEADADTPVRAVGIRASPRFHFLAAPAGFHRDISNDRRLPSEGDCEDVDPDRAKFFEAPDARSATDGYGAFLRLQDALRGGSDVPLSCSLHHGETDCRALILGFRPHNIDEIAPCTRYPDGRRCFDITLFDRRIAIELDPESETPVVRSARLVSTFVLVHERID